MHSRRKTPFLIAASAFLVCTAHGGPADASGPDDAIPPDVPGAPRELGRVSWLRSFDAAVERGTADNKPLLVLFQEVPGCDTCVRYGDEVLSHPLIVEAAETLFIPVAIFNNVKGEDERILKSFNEPAWNNPVVRVVTADRRPLAERVAGDYTIGKVATAMVDSLRKTRKPVPPYLSLLAEEYDARKRGVEQGVFAMHCFWEGEAAFGALSGVVATMPGFLNSEEVVEVVFDPQVIPYGKLLEKARAFDCARRAYTRSDAQHAAASGLLGADARRTDQAVRPDKQPKYYLSQTAYKHVPMTSLQSTRVNAAVHRKEDPKRFLSPRQVKLLGIVEKNPTAEWPHAIEAEDLGLAWHQAVEIARSLGAGL